MDREQKLRRIKEISLIQATLKTEYESLRDEVVPEVEPDGVVWVLGPDGNKYRCSVRRDMVTTFDLDVLFEELNPDVFEEITVRKVDSTKFEQAADAGRIPTRVVQKAVRRKPKAAFVDFKVDGPQ